MMIIVNAEQARLLQVGAALVGAMVRDDSHGVEVLMADFADEAQGPDALLYVAIAAADTWCLHTGRRQTAVADLWPLLRPPEPPANEFANREAICTLATAIRAGTQAERDAAQAQINDRGVMLVSAMDLATAALEALAIETRVSSAEWCRRWAEGAAAGAGVETPDL